MASIASLLNPSTSDADAYEQLPSPCSTSDPKEFPSPPPQSKKLKPSKDAPVFIKGDIRGQLRYPPCEERDEKLAMKQREFQIHPMGQIALYPRHIPYNSEKKSYLGKTGRESFEVLQYTFKIPGEDKPYTVIWDYNIGLTTPAKMLNANPGLREICHSITGGSLAAQGYWIPFDAAKAIATTFCWNIRYALTPLFGTDFPSICIRPNDPLFGRMIIRQDIIKKSTECAERFRLLENRAHVRSENFLRSPASPRLPQFDAWNRKELLPKLRPSADSPYNCAPKMDNSQIYAASPTNPYRSGWTPVDAPRTLHQVRVPPGPRGAVLDPVTRGSVAEDCDVTTESSILSEGTATTEQATSLASDSEYSSDDSQSDEDSASEDSTYPESNAGEKRGRSRSLRKETHAAYMLIKLHMRDAAMGQESLKRKRRRASTGTVRPITYTPRTSLL